MKRDQEYLNSEEFLRDYILQNGVPNKDEFIQPKVNVHVRKVKERPQGNGPIEVRADEELDLHGMTVDEALANLEIMMDQMKFAGHKTLRVIHGGGFGQYGPVKKYFDRHISGPLKSRISSVRKEGHNSGATLLFLK